MKVELIDGPFDGREYEVDGGDNVLLFAVSPDGQHFYDAAIRRGRPVFHFRRDSGDGVLTTLEAENAKLRDLLRRVYACAENGSSAVDTTVRLALMLAEIKSAIEPGNPGEVGEA